MTKTHHRSTLQTTTQLEPKDRKIHSLEAVFRQLGTTPTGTRSPKQDERRIWRSFNSLTLLLMDKLSGHLRRFLARDHRKTTWTIDDFLTALKRELQVMEQDKTKEIYSMTKLQPRSTAVFYTDQTQSSKHNTELDTERRTQDQKNQQRSVLSVDHHFAAGTAQNTSTLMIASK